MEVTVRKAEKEDASQPSDITAMRETIERVSKRPEYYVAVAERELESGS